MRHSSFSNIYESYFIKEGVKPCDLLKKVQETINSIIPRKYSISMIRVYAQNNNNLWLVSATEFLWERRIKIDEHPLSDFIHNNEIPDAKQKQNISIKFKTHDELWFLKHVGEEKYYYCCEYTKGSMMWINNPIVIRMISKMFTKTSLAIFLNHRTLIRRQRNFDEIKGEIIFVNKAVNVMHFIRNRLSPLTNVINYLKRRDAISDKRVKYKMDSLLKREVLQAERDLNEIISTANFLLDRTRNPFDEGEIIQTKASQAYIVVSEIVQMILEDTVNVGENLRNCEEGKEETMYVKTNLKELKILVSDWINNIKKYKNNHYEGHADIINNYLVFKFVNDFPANEFDNVRQLVTDINSKTKDAVISSKKYGHGLFVIKNIAQLMDYTISASISEKDSVGTVLNFNLEINTYHEKDINL